MDGRMSARGENRRGGFDLASRPLAQKEGAGTLGLGAPLLCCWFPEGSGFSSVLRTLGGVQDAEGVAAIGPDEQQRVFAFWYPAQGLLDVGGALDVVAVDLDDYVAALQSGVVGGAAGLHLLDHGAMNVARSLQLLTKIRTEVAETYAPVHFAVISF